MRSRGLPDGGRAPRARGAAQPADRSDQRVAPPRVSAERSWPPGRERELVEGMNKLRMVASALALAAGSQVHAASGWGLLNMPQGVTDMSRQIYDLHMMMLWVCVAIGVIVFGVMIYSIITFRHSRGAVPDTTMVHNTKVEIVWTVIPIAILIATAIPAARTLVEIEDLRNTQLTIKVTG